MATTTVLKQCLDAHVDENKPAVNFGKVDRLRVSNATSNHKSAYLFFGSMPHPGVYVLEATLTLHALTAFSSQTITVKRVTESWKERTVTWRRKPATTATHDATPTVSLSANDAVDIDVTDMVRDALLDNGAPFYGFELTTGSTGTFAFYSSETDGPFHRPTLEITFARTPTAAADLVPGDGAVIGTDKPVLRWSYFDLDGEEQGAFQVQIDATDFASPDFDTGWVTSADPQYVIADGAFGGWAADAVKNWRVRVQDESGQESGWSEAVAVTRTIKGTLTLDAPSSTVEETLPTITTTLTGRDQDALAYILDELQSDGTWREVWRKSRFIAETTSGDDYSFRIELIEDGRPRKQVSPVRYPNVDYLLTVRSWDDVRHRVATSRDPTYVEVQRVFQWNPTGGPATPSDLVTAADMLGGPGVKLTWHRDAVPDYWNLVVDGEVVADHIDATDWLVSE